MDLDMARARFPQAAAYNPMGELGPVAITAEVAQVNMAQLGRNQFLGDHRRRIIREMPVPAEDPLFDAPRAAGVLLEQF